MKTNSNKEHWENIYATKNPDEVSWTEEVPEISLSFINSFQLPKTGSIIDIGGGESRLAGCLLDTGYIDITVLDISEKSIEKAKKRLGKRADEINWVVQDITEFDTDQLFDCWHDRATFHFLTKTDQIVKYSTKAKQFVKQFGYMVIGTFSEKGPEKCSGLPIRQYNQQEMSHIFSDGFRYLNSVFHDHETPFKTKQSFLYNSFQRI
jgi:ubiquinone/menaquinone biosynthesis C-methylase UbiE